MKRKLLSILLVLAMALTLLPVSALAEDGAESSGNVAKIGETEYATLAAAVSAAADGQTIKLLNDASTDVLKAGLTYDLAGHTLTYTKNAPFTYASKTTSFIDTSVSGTNRGGTISAPNIRSTQASINVQSGATLNLNNIIFRTPGSGFFPQGDAAAVNVDNCDVYAGVYCLGTNAATTDNYNVVISLSNSNFCATASDNDNCPIYINLTGTLNIDNCNVVGGRQGLMVRAGTVNITNSDIKTTGGYSNREQYYTSNWGSGNELPAAALIVGNYNAGAATAYFDNATVTLTDTKLTGENNFPALYVDGNTTYKGTVAINGDNSAISGAIMKGQNPDAAGISIAAGAFTDLANAVAYAENNATVTLLKDISSPKISAIVSGKAVTIDLNGHSITRTVTENAKENSAYPALYVYNEGNLTLTDTSASGTGKVISEITASEGKGCSSSAVFVDNGSFTLEKGSLVATAGNDSDQASCVDLRSGAQFTMNGGSIAATSDDGGAYGVVVTANCKLTLNDGTINASGYAVSGNGNGENANTEIVINGGSLVGGELAIYHPQAGTLTINGGSMTGKGGIESKAGNATITISGNPTITATGEPKHTANSSGNSTEGYAIAVVENKNYAGAAKVSIGSGYFTGKIDIVSDTEVSADKKAAISITSGYFTEDPSAYVAEGYYADASDIASYTYMVKQGSKADAIIIVKDNTEVTAVADSGLTEEDLNKTVVDGTAEAIADSKKDDIAVAAGVTQEQLAAPENRIEVEVKVNVKLEDVKKTDDAVTTLTYTALPTATVKVNGTSTGSEVSVPNTYLNGKAIEVKLPLPTGFVPKQIKHTSSNGSVEYFINESEGTKLGAGTFKVEDGCAVFTITHFSVFELSGSVTYVEPVYVPGATGYVVNVVPATNGTVSASHKTAAAGTTVTVTVSPANGYELSGLTVTDARGNALTLTDLGNGKYSFVMPASKVDVTAAFAAKSAAGFRDVAADAYYAPAVAWAVEKGITNGVTADLFAPAEPCTRGQIVTFLWRAAGSPAPKTSVNPFTDVTSADYYYNAVLWAVENGVTEGTSDTTFSPSAVCTRAQAVTFLCRALKGSASSAAAFTDVPADAYYAASVNWAVANGVTKGTSDTTFSPDASCTRAEIVTFLYRAYQGK